MKPRSELCHRERSQKKLRLKISDGVRNRISSRSRGVKQVRANQDQACAIRETLRKAQLQIFRQLQESVAALDAARVAFLNIIRGFGVRDREFAYRELYFFENPKIINCI